MTNTKTSSGAYIQFVSIHEHVNQNFKMISYVPKPKSIPLYGFMYISSKESYKHTCMV